MTEELGLIIFDPNEKYNDRQKLFITYYLSNGMNARQACISAGYSQKNTNNSARLLAVPKIRKVIDRYLEQYSLSALEVLARLSDHARANIGDIITVNDDGRSFDLDPEKIKQYGHLIKSITHTQQGLRVELHDPQQAMSMIAKARGMFKQIQVVDITARQDTLDYSKLSDSELNDLERLLSKAKQD